MVGSFFAKYTDPIKIENIRDNEQIENQNFSLGILHININRSAALEFQHLKDKIIEKINSYFGYKAISKIVSKYKNFNYFYFSSFDLKSLVEMKKIFPDFHYGLLVDNFENIYSLEEYLKICKK